MSSVPPTANFAFARSPIIPFSSVPEILSLMFSSLSAFFGLIVILSGYVTVSHERTTLLCGSASFPDSLSESNGSVPSATSSCLMNASNSNSSCCLIAPSSIPVSAWAAGANTITRQTMITPNITNGTRRFRFIGSVCIATSPLSYSVVLSTNPITPF